jgi:V8-like Glu-specific endopeptidase
MALDKPTYDKATAFMFDPQRKAVYVQKQSLVQKAFQLVESTSVLQDADQSGDMKAGPGVGGGGVSPRQQPQRPAARAAPAIATPAGLPDADAMRAMLNRFMAGGAGRKLLHIIGGDERAEIGDKAHQWPYTAVGHLQHRKGVCTGVMISNRAVLTAGHCIYSRKRRAWQENLVFIPARHRVNGQFIEPYGRIPYLTATTYSGWVQNGDDKDALQYDLAVVRLSDENIGYKTGWLGLAWDKKGFNGWVTTAGYASDKPRGEWERLFSGSDVVGAFGTGRTLCSPSQIGGLQKGCVL